MGFQSPLANPQVLIFLFVYPWYDFGVSSIPAALFNMVEISLTAKSECHWRMSSHACNGYLKGEPAMRGLPHALTSVLNWLLRQGQPKRIRKSHFDGNIKPLLENSLTYPCERRGMWVKGNHGMCVHCGWRTAINVYRALPKLNPF